MNNQHLFSLDVPETVQKDIQIFAPSFSQQLVERYRQVSKAFAGGVEDSIGDGGRHADYADLTQPLGTERVDDPDQAPCAGRSPGGKAGSDVARIQLPVIEAGAGRQAALARAWRVQATIWPAGMAPVVWAMTLIVGGPLRIGGGVRPRAGGCDREVRAEEIFSAGAQHGGYHRLRGA